MHDLSTQLSMQYLPLSRAPDSMLLSDATACSPRSTSMRAAEDSLLYLGPRIPGVSHTSCHAGESYGGVKSY
jgi:hypothetical protein